MSLPQLSLTVVDTSDEQSVSAAMRPGTRTGSGVAHRRKVR
jgi:hypothetical protein